MSRIFEVNKRVIFVKSRPLGWYVIGCTLLMTAKIALWLWDVILYAFDSFTI